DNMNEKNLIDFRKIKQAILDEPIPMHMKNWFYALGVTPFILFIFQVLTGILLTIYYVPSPELAYKSVKYITEEVRLGFWIRGLHRWGSNLMVVAVFLHMVRVFFTRAYRRPRELNWIIGVLMFFITLGLCFTGYSLIYDQLSYWATTVGTNMIKEIPIFGSLFLHLLRGGEIVSVNTLTRFFNLHVIFLPTSLLMLIALHIILVRVHGVSQLEGIEDDEVYKFYPEHVYHGAIIALFLLTVMSALTVVLPPGIGEPADPNVTPLHIKPEWYFFAIYFVLKYVPLKLGITLMLIFLIIMTFWPFIDELLRKKFPQVKWHYILGSIVILLFLIFTVYETVSY
ncbi:ubiquinol-cytochrome c reductase cytochrome b subunit, partial [Candidatus Kryptonium thompsonii]